MSEKRIAKAGALADENCPSEKDPPKALDIPRTLGPEPPARSPERRKQIIRVACPKRDFGVAGVGEKDIKWEAQGYRVPKSLSYTTGW
jgi:hypothetical protein